MVLVLPLTMSTRGGGSLLAFGRFGNRYSEYSRFDLSVPYTPAREQRDVTWCWDPENWDQQANIKHTTNETFHLYQYYIYILVSIVLPTNHTLSTHSV